MHTLRSVLTLGLICSGAIVAQGASLVVNNPARVAGEDAINPASRTLTVATGATPLATLQQRADFAAIQDFAGFNTTGGRTISSYDSFIYTFTDPLLPATRFTYGGNYADENAVIGGSSGSISQHSTSEGGASLRLAMPGTSTSSLTIDFGSYSSADGFAVSPLNSGVSAAAFTLSGSRAENISILYLDALGNTLSDQIITSVTTGSALTYGYTGYQITDGQAPIASIVISVTSRVGYRTTLGFDDFFFTPLTVIPEPSTISAWVGVVALGACAFASKRRRRQSK